MMYRAKHIKETPEGAKPRRFRVCTLAVAAVACVAAVSVAALGTWAFLKEVTPPLVNTFMAKQEEPVILETGVTFQSHYAALGDSITTVIFGDYDTYKSNVVEDGAVNVDEGQEGLIKLYKGTDNKTAYVLSNGKIYANPSSRSMFYNTSSDDTHTTSIRFENFDTSKVKNMGNMFRSCSGLQTLTGLKEWNTAAVTDMSYMFYSCESLTDLDVSTWNTSAVTNMERLFSYCTGLSELDIVNFDTREAWSIKCMFAGLTGITELVLGPNFQTDNVREMFGVFGGCTNLEVIYASVNWSRAGLPYSNWGYDGGVFSDCTSLKTAVGQNLTGYSGATYSSHATIGDYFTDVKKRPPIKEPIRFEKGTTMILLNYRNVSAYPASLMVYIDGIGLIARSSEEIVFGQVLQNMPIMESKKEQINALSPGDHIVKLM